MTYTPQELIIKTTCDRAGLSFCLYRDYIIVWGKGKVYSRQVEDMNSFLGIKC